MNPGRVKAWLTAPALGLVVALVLPTVVVLLRLAFCRPAHGTGFYQPGSFTLEHFQRLFSGDGVALLAFTLGFALAVAAGVLLLGRQDSGSRVAEMAQSAQPTRQTVQQTRVAAVQVLQALCQAKTVVAV